MIINSKRCCFIMSILFYHVYLSCLLFYECHLLQVRFMKMLKAPGLKNLFRSHNWFSVGKMIWLVKEFAKSFAFVFSKHITWYLEESLKQLQYLLQKAPLNLRQSVLPALHSYLCPKPFLKWEYCFSETWQCSGPMLSCASKSCSYYDKILFKRKWLKLVIGSPKNRIFHLFGKTLVICFCNRWKSTLLSPSYLTNLMSAKILVFEL